MGELIVIDSIEYGQNRNFAREGQGEVIGMCTLE